MHISRDGGRDHNMTPEQKLEAIREELEIYIERLDRAEIDYLFEYHAGRIDKDQWPDYEMWARQGAGVDLQKIVEILDE